MTSAETVRTAAALAGAPAALLAAVTLTPPDAAPLLCAGLLGAASAAVVFALTGWRVLTRRGR